MRTYKTRQRLKTGGLLFLLLACDSLAPASIRAQQVMLKPFRPGGIYPLGETAGWTITTPDGGEAPSGKFKFVVKSNNWDVLKTGEVNPSIGDDRIEVSLGEPAMLYVTVTPPAAETHDAKRELHEMVAAAAIAPDKLQPVAPRPADFDDFWKAKVAQLRDVPPNPVLTPGDSGRPGVDYAIITMDHVDGEHVYGQLAKPAGPGKFPALLQLQWASPPYPLERSWVVDRAAQGWLALNIEPHNVPCDKPKSFYDALPDALKHYESIGNYDRDRSYFLRMYLADVRAVDYLASRPDWDGKTLVVLGTSMGGQQSLCVAGLHDRVTHVIVNEPAGCDTNAPLHGRQVSYPFFPASDPQVMQTALYFDAVNFAPRIKATSLVAMGFLDTVAAPAGIWTAFNQIAGPKEAAPMIDSPHNHMATPAQQRPFTERSEEWLEALVHGRAVKPRPLVVAQEKAVAATAPVPAAAARPAPPAVDDHQLMMEQLGIKSLRPGANPNNQDTFDEASANRYADSMPDVLTRNDGTKVSTADAWPSRRGELIELFAREVYGRIPENVPTVAWEVAETTAGDSGGIPTISKRLVGRVDNSAYPQVTVEIQASFMVPASAKAPVPLMIAFGSLRPRGGFGPPRTGVPWTQQAIAHGWGYATLDPGSIQADNKDQLRAGIIGLTSRGQLRKPDEWGALRAWQWGVSRLIDYFEATPDAHVDPAKIGIEGLSRYGKAALVTQAFDERVAVGFIASSGEGGAKLHRHIFGEALENLAGGEYYWMAGNLLKYAAADATFGPKTAADLPVDSHELIALCAPRPCFISYGTIAGGDPNWVDARGSFMAGVLAGPVYRLLGKQDFGTPGDYLTDSMPAVGELIGGELAWRQHAGGHDATPNWPAFFEWVAQYIPSQPPERAAALSPERRAAALSPERRAAQPPADQPVERTDANSRLAHKQLLEKAARGGIDVYFLGDSITRRWGTSDPQYADFLANWTANFHGWNAGNFGWGGDTTQNILWRLEHGELDNVNPKVIVLLTGTNNLGGANGAPPDAAEIARGIEAIAKTCRTKAPEATIIITAIFPRSDKAELLPAIDATNAQLAKLANGRDIRFLNVNDAMTDEHHRLVPGTMVDGLHPAVRGYQTWADGLKPILTELLGPPAAEDHAPPPTGDPSASANAKQK
jgi:cephalosporin-C deacetylase-like acetyl esterase/lysophospholipase L1-like esterase